MISLEQLAENRVPWGKLDQFEDRNIFQTLPWITFIARTQGAEPVIAEVKENGAIIGYFTGLKVNKFGFNILGSPFKGWTTEYMGFNLRPGSSRRQILEKLSSFAFEKLGCQYVELVDRQVNQGDCKNLPYLVTYSSGFEIDLTKDEDRLLADMDSACRRCIRKAAKTGVSIEEADGIGFAEDYFVQLKDVFAKQSLAPTYGIERVQELIRSLHPTGHLLLLRARHPEGMVMATGIFPAFNDTMYFWGGASLREYQILRPNEAIIWHAMRYWKSRGIKKFDMGGGGEYKRKYGGYEISVPCLIKAKYDFLIPMRNLAQKTWKMTQKLRGRFK
jgi:CelD/BcsL family acetyltransferase involved in cellulose biosynthesis